MSSRRRFPTACALGLTLALGPAALSGCTRYAAPTLRTAGVSVADETAEGLVLAFSLDASNPNDVPLPLRDVHYSLWLEGQEVFTGVRSAQATLSRKGTGRIVLPAVVAIQPGRPAPSGVVRYRLAGSLVYQTPGEIAQILFDTGVRRPTAQFADAGELDLGRPADSP